jgi:hypothetical protein
MCALATAGLAAAAAGDAARCHPDLPGTRSLTVTGHVVGYTLTGGRVDVHWVRSSDCAGTAVWNYAAVPHAKASAPCRQTTTPAQGSAARRLVAAQGNRIVRVVLAPASVDRPDRLQVLDRATRRLIASWPLFERPARVALYSDIAILSSAKRHALDALRISDGRIAMLGIARAGDRPVIGPAGVLYEDDLDLYMHRASPDLVTLKLVPLAIVRRQFAAPEARRINTSRINAISMDGKRVAFVVHDQRGQCDRVLFWSIPWHFVAPFTQKVGPTCLPTHAPGGVTNVAIAGDRAVWTTRYGGTTRVIASSIINCVEWVVARPGVGAQHVAGLTGDGGVLAYAVNGRASTVSLVPTHWRSRTIAGSDAAVAGISADSARVAALQKDGTVSIVTRSGRLVGQLSVGSSRAIALRRKTLAVLGHASLTLYRLGSNHSVQRWTVPADATSVDLQYGIALLTAGHDVIAVNTSTGRTARLLHAPGRVEGQIEAPGATVAFNVGNRGHLRFIPMSVIEARTS